jgi:hypothetical protein
MGPAAAEKAINMTMEVVDLARIAKKTANRPTICFDEWNVWDAGQSIILLLCIFVLSPSFGLLTRYYRSSVLADGEKGSALVFSLSRLPASSTLELTFCRKQVPSRSTPCRMLSLSPAGSMCSSERPNRLRSLASLKWVSVLPCCVATEAYLLLLPVGQRHQPSYDLFNRHSEADHLLPDSALCRIHARQGPRPTWWVARSGSSDRQYLTAHTLYSRLASLRRPHRLDLGPVDLRRAAHLDRYLGFSGGWARSKDTERRLRSHLIQDVESSTLNLVLVNRHGSLDFDVQLRLASAEQVSGEVEVFEVHHEDVGAINSWEDQPVGIVKSTEKWTGSATVKAHSLQLLRIPLK